MFTIRIDYNLPVRKFHTDDVQSVAADGTEATARSCMSYDMLDTQL